MIEPTDQQRTEGIRFLHMTTGVRSMQYAEQVFDGLIEAMNEAERGFD